VIAIPLIIIAPVVMLLVLAVAILSGVHAVKLSHGQSVPGWIGLALGVFLGVGLMLSIALG
jgi:hypothetical protein